MPDTWPPSPFPADTGPFRMPTRKAQHMDTQPTIDRTRRTNETTIVGFTFPQLIELAFESLLESADGLPNPRDGEVSLRVLGDRPDQRSVWSTADGDFVIERDIDTGRHRVNWPTSGYPAASAIAVSVTITRSVDA